MGRFFRPAIFSGNLGYFISMSGYSDRTTLLAFSLHGRAEGETMPSTMMKLRLALLIAASAGFLGLSFSQAQTKPEATAKIMALENKWNEAYLKADIASLDSLLVDDFFITVEDGNTYSKPGYIAHAGDKNVHVEVAEISDVKIRVHGNTAVVTGAYHEKGTSKGKPYEYRDRYTDIWMSIGGNWQLIASHFAVPFKG